MCVAKTPKIPKPSESEKKSLPIIRNPILDGILGNIAAIRNGRNALRIDLLNPLAIPIGGAPGGGGAGGGGGSTGGSTGGSSGGGSVSGSGGTISTGGTSFNGSFRTVNQ